LDALFTAGNGAAAAVQSCPAVSAGSREKEPRGGHTLSTDAKGMETPATCP